MTYLSTAQHALPATASIFSSHGAHLSLEVTVPIVAAVVLIKVVAARLSGQSALGNEIVVRCSRGHLFTAKWSPLGSFTSIRLGSARYQYCPVGDHWSLVRRVNDAELTPEDRQIAEQNSR